MSNNSKYGEISWSDDFAPGGKKPSNNKDIWLRLDDGSNEVRLVTQPYQYLVHKYKKEGDQGYGQKINCSAVNGSCPVCDLGDEFKAKPRWLLGVISRKTGTYKILDISYGVFQQIRKLAAKPTWGDPTKYDIDIFVDRKGGATGYYSVQPIPKEPLSAEDQKIKDEVDFDELKRKVTPPTPEFAQKRLDSINGVTGTTSTMKTAAKTPAPVDTSSSDEDDDDDAFPSYEG